ncbi:hypothetical protein [Flavobacterium sp. NKUCC04_CG]|uniref:hypothetical protein n=1 Tax=Flavobacterium sp. NKUCC04_CG TaxID=2842121 RepID=UPI001C5B9AB3|nr:hypothetical protein [Flavobacterium sp. NKUCC04_CG]MBW3519186.1 hypothetical protein [Flavobacterium sp. NKUCC04_CG]
MSIITAITISRMMSPLRGWFGDLFENNGIPQGVENVYRNTMSIITTTTISRMMSPLRGWLGICLKITASHTGLKMFIKNNVHNYGNNNI